MQYSESTDVHPQRQHGDGVETTEVVERVCGKYRQRRHSMDALFKYKASKN